MVVGPNDLRISITALVRNYENLLDANIKRGKLSSESSLSDADSLLYLKDAAIVRVICDYLTKTYKDAGWSSVSIKITGPKKTDGCMGGGTTYYVLTWDLSYPQDVLNISTLRDKLNRRTVDSGGDPYLGNRVSSNGRC